MYRWSRTEERSLVALHPAVLSTLIPFCLVDCLEEVKIDAGARYRMSVLYYFFCVMETQQIDLYNMRCLCSEAISV